MAFQAACFVLKQWSGSWVMETQFGEADDPRNAEKSQKEKKNLCISLEYREYLNRNSS